MADIPLVDAVVTAGGKPQPGEPLYPLTQGGSKALLPIGGRPMIQWVLDALSGAACVRSIVVAGLAADEAPLTARQPLAFLPSAGSLIGNVEAGARWVIEHHPEAQVLLAVSSDIPTLKPHMVEWMVKTCLETDHEAYYGLVPHQLMEQRFPGSRRSFFRLRDGRFTGSDMNVLQLALVGHYHPAWQAVAAARKHIGQQARLVGLGTLLLYLTGRLSIAEAERRVAQRLGVRGRALVCPYAEIGMDVDKPAQYEMLKRELEAVPA
jgi:GTP:adenosylcobinamide-phosphate guanylyltransferase